MNDLLYDLAEHTGCRVVWRTAPLESALGEDGPTVEIKGVLQHLPPKRLRGPSELTTFREQIISADLFLNPADGPAPANAWRVEPTDTWLYTTVDMWLVGSLELGGVEYLEHCFVLASSLRGSDRVIAVDLHEERFGWIGYYWYMGDLSEGGFPVIAKSFAEWLERSLASSPDARYWEREDFVDLGPAIPNDPNYHPPNRRAPRGRP